MGNLTYPEISKRHSAFFFKGWYVLGRS